jgi:hypothetical protein
MGYICVEERVSEGPPLRTTMADNFHPSRDVVEVPLEVVLRDILTHTHQSVYLTVVSDGIVSIY